MSDDLRDPETGRFLPGNRFWEARSSAGPNPKFQTAEQLAEACAEYFEWVEANPLYEAKPFSYEGNVTIAPVAKMRAMSIGALCLFLDVSHRQWINWRSERADLLPVMEAVEQAIRNQKFEGASAGLLNANIIARDLGLADKSEITGKDGGPIETKELSKVDLARKVAFLLMQGVSEPDA